MIREDGRYCNGCGLRIPGSALLAQETMSPEEAHEYGSDAPPDSDGTVTIDLCLQCRIRRADRIRGR
jgi:hypothetical protein